MTIDAALLREAQDVLRLYSSSAQKLIQDNLYGPREARLAGAVVKNAFTVIVHEQTTETKALRDLRVQAWQQIEKLCELLGKTTAIIEERVALDVGMRDLLDECEAQIVSATDDFEVEVDEETPL